MHRLVLGTAQLGFPYGIANARGQPSMAEAEAIVAAVWERGVRWFDTAQDYGMSEERLGAILSRHGRTADAAVVTKLGRQVALHDPTQVRAAVVDSLRRLKVPQLAGLLLHQEEALDRWAVGLGEGLRRCVDAGLVRAIGISVYSPARALAAFTTAGIDLVQVPTNALDRRFLDAGVFAKAAACRKRVFIRSVFLQGLLVMQRSQVPPAMSAVRPLLERLDTCAEGLRISHTALALGYVKLAAPSAQILFGTETAVQAVDTMRCWKTAPPADLVERVHALFPTPVDERVVNPTLWPQSAAIAAITMGASQ